MDFQKIVVNSEQKIKTLLEEGKPEEFSKELTNLYPRMMKFFPEGTYGYLNQTGFATLLEEVTSSSKDLLLQSYQSYAVDYVKKEVTLTRKDQTVEKFSLFELVFVLENGFDVIKDSEGFYLKLSYLMQPSQFEIMQLFAFFNLQG